MGPRISSDLIKYTLFLIVVAFFPSYKMKRSFLFICLRCYVLESFPPLAVCVPFQELNMDKVRILHETPLIHFVTQGQETGAAATCTSPGSWSGSLV